MRLVLMLFVCLSLISRAASLAGENPQVIISIYNDAEVPPGTLTRAEQRTSKIFADAGLDITWLNCPCSGGVPETLVARQIGGSANLVLHITTHVADTTSDAAFGVAFLGLGGTGRYTDVFWKKVESLQQYSHLDTAAILGSVMAHEIGHLLLGSNGHAISGIMQPRWEAAELHRISMGTLLFLPEQAARMRARMAEAKPLPISGEGAGF